MTPAPPVIARIDGRRYASSAHQMTSLLLHAANYNLWPHFGRALLRRLRVADQQDGREQLEARDRWEEAAIDTESALRRLGVSAPVISLRRRFPELWIAAERRVKQCPIPFQDLGIAAGADVELLYYLCRHVRAHRVLETGVALGWSSLAVLLALAAAPGARLHSVDLPYTRLRATKWVGIVVPPSLKAFWTLHRMADPEGLPRALAEGPFDLCHYDSDTTVEGRMWAYPRMWAALRPGGLLISDDIADNQAWRTFCAQIGRETIVVRTGSKHVGILVKAR
jgi:predicted O-methyltransferase YrrM